MENLEIRLFFQIFHAMLRVDNSSAEEERTALILNWFGENLTTVIRVCERAQKDLLGVVWEHWMENKSAPSLTILDGMIRKRDKPDAMLDLVKEYKEHLPDLKVYDHLDMPELLRSRKEDWEKCLVGDLLGKASRICKGSVAGPKPTDPPLTGARDAIAYLFNKVQEGALVTDFKVLGGSLKDKADGIYDKYIEARQDNLENKLSIPTDLLVLDRIIGGIKRKAFWGCLGFAGQRKSAVCRTIAYFAATKGFRVLHIPLESEFDEEMAIYGIIHSHNKKFSAMGFALDISRYYDGNLTDQEEVFLRDVVIPDMKKTIAGDIIIRQPVDQTWSSIQNMIDLENRVAPIDLVFIDYLALFDVSKERDHVGAINNIIKEVKRMCLTFDNGRGVAIITPVQGNREGRDRAKTNGGVWDKEGIAQFNEFEKSLDVCLYVYQDEELSSENKIKLGSCKSRRSADIPCTTFIVEPHSGRVLNMTDGREITPEHWNDDRNILESIV